MSQHSPGRIVRNIIALLITQLGTWTITLVLTLVLPRYLGVQLYGVYAFVFSFTGFVSIGMNLGMGTYLTWRIAQHPEEAGKLTLNALAIQVPLAIAFSLLALVSVPLTDTSLLVIHLTVITAAANAAGAMVSTCVSGLAGLQNMRVPSFIGLGCSTAGTVGILITVQMHGNIVVLAACGLGAQSLNLLLMFAYAQVKLHLLGPIDFRLWPKIVGGGMPFFAWSVVLLFYGQVDITLTKVLAGDTVVGWYAAANRIVSIPVFLPTIVVTAVLPALSHERVPSSPRFRQLATHSMRMVMLVGIPAAAGTVLLATHLVALLRFPATFNQISPLIVILGVNMPLIGLDMVLGTVLIATGRQKAWTGVGIISAIFNPLANLWAIPFTQHMYGNGAIGASVVTVATECIMLVGALVLLPRPLFTWADVGYIVRCLVAAALMIPAVHGIIGYGTISIALAVTYGVVIYAMAAYILRLFTNDDIRAVVQTIQARLGTSGAQLDGRMVADNARRVLANVQISAQTAAGRLMTISRPLATGATHLATNAARAMGTISQPLTSAVRQTAARMGGAISRPLGSIARNAGFVPGEGALAPATTETGAESDPLTVLPWGMQQIATAPAPVISALTEADAPHNGHNGHNGNGNGSVGNAGTASTASSADDEPRHVEPSSVRRAEPSKVPPGVPRKVPRTIPLK